jgi:sialate O-acetylesterase
MKKIDISPLINDKMIIQRETLFPILSREKITVTFLEKKYQAQPKEGKWLITLDPVKAGGPFTMEIESENEKITVQDIFAGDLWLCAGQSNMELSMDRLRDNFSEEWKEDFPLIRQFKVPQEWDFSAPRDELSGGNCLCASAQTLHEFSGTAWFFAKKMYEKYRIPIGLINTAWGGTPVESWMSKEALKDFPEKIAAAEQYTDVTKNKELDKNTTDAIQMWETNLAREDEGIAKEWQKTETDISAWNEITLPGNFSDAGLYDFTGSVWLAKEFEVTANFAAEEAKVWLGTITDADTVFINGTEIGNTTYRYPPRKYTVKASLLKEGKNRIAIRVMCNSGEGGVTGDKPFKIFTDNETIQFSGTWKYKVGAGASFKPAAFFFQWQPIGNYNAMISPVLKYPLTGVIWYQGESNSSNANEYSKLFKLMINDWRKKNSNENLPFLFVQLPIFGEAQDNNEQSSWALIREAQAQALSLPATGMAAALELGEWNDLHPLNKKDVGIRLFLAAEKTINKIENTSPGPMLSRVERKQERLYLYFDNCGSGLKVCNDGEKAYVSVVGVEQIRLPAEIEGQDAISVDLSSVKSAKKILYAWADNPRDMQLINSNGLPVIPFRAEI